MGFLRRSKQPKLSEREDDLAKTLGAHGKAATGRLLSIRRTADAPFHDLEVEFRTQEGAAVRASARQRLAPELAADWEARPEQCGVLYDARDPKTVVVMGPPRAHHPSHGGGDDSSPVDPLA